MLCALTTSALTVNNFITALLDETTMSTLLYVVYRLQEYNLWPEILVLSVTYNFAT